MLGADPPPGDDTPPRERPTGLLFPPRTAPINGLAEETLARYKTLSAEDIVKEVKKLGRGQFGEVHHVIHRDGRKMARKTIQLVPQADQNRILDEELDALSACKTPHITAFFGAYCSGPAICICMELMDLSLEDVLFAAGFVPEKHSKWIAFNVVKGIEYLKNFTNRVHRDIKPANILVNRQGEVKMCDMGLSRTLVKSIAVSKTGTYCYMSPERLEGKKYTVRADVWSLGITLVQLFTGRYPFGPLDQNVLRKKRDLFMRARWVELVKLTMQERDPEMTTLQLSLYIIDEAEPPPSLPEACFDTIFCDFVAKCLKKNEADRAAVGGLIEHGFLLSLKSSTSEFDDDNSRLTQANLKAHKFEFSSFVQTALDLKAKRENLEKQTASRISISDRVKSWLSPFKRSAQTHD